MKKMSLAIFLILVFAMSAMAELTTAYTTGVAQVVCTSCKLYKITPIGGDADANTAAGRTVMFYNNTSVRVSSHPHDDVVVFTWALAPGQYPTDVPALEGNLHTKWGGTVVEGYDYSSGLVISPTASEMYEVIYQDY